MVSKIDKREETSVIILAAGEAKRMNGLQKQLLNIGNHTVIGRIIHQVKMRGCEPFVVSNDKDILAVANSWIMPRKYSVTCETFMSTSHLWNKRTIVLLGDVLYSKMCMDYIFDCLDPVAVFGDAWEIYAVTFMFRQRHKVMRALETGKDYGLGKLRYFYRAYCGFPMDMEDRGGVTLEPDVFKYIFDWTRDIDTLEEYHNTIRELVTTRVLTKNI